ncbi:HTH domain-containing protein (plasmid) [Butyrivibrio proteoclasticus B316]|uniref:HTH domain-containing protein n=1 Tax=Butyrivibrio proteoclasticus (strain ATCC 51982 / DSM 14932 / B316) TaxID=515622 RepID=E0S3S1_BUTPB|nr:helix-turn-helix transcriptional regulator [Butyrivibrio proteoclasticus]ADL36053.1 HTH domain-containing protein [Butyrivibrio proteoclasticus B316]
MNIRARETGIRIRLQLELIGKTQRELAKDAGITEVSLSRYITGDREPKGTVLLNLAKALGTTTDYLLGLDIKGDFDSEYLRAKAWVARNASRMTIEQKADLASKVFS